MGKTNSKCMQLRSDRTKLLALVALAFSFAFAAALSVGTPRALAAETNGTSELQAGSISAQSTDVAVRRDGKLLKLKATAYSLVYNGKFRKARVVVYNGKKKLRPGKDYTLVRPKSRNVGRYRVTVKGKNYYKGCKTSATYVINPKHSKILSLKTMSGRLAAKWRKIPARKDGYKPVDRYEVNVSTNSYINSQNIKFVFDRPHFGFNKNGKSPYFKQGAFNRFPVKGNVVFVKVRTWKKAGGKWFCSRWSATKAFVPSTTWNEKFIAGRYSSGTTAVFKDIYNSSSSRVKNWNPKIASMYRPDLNLEIMKPGNAKTSFTYYGKRITLNASIFKWEAPVSLVKIGSRDVTEGVLNWNGTYPNGCIEIPPPLVYDGSELKGKLTVEPTKNWTATMMQAYGEKGTKTITKSKKSGYIEIMGANGKYSVIPGSVLGYINNSTKDRNNYGFTIRLENKLTGVETELYLEG